ncbi:hypothetical protein [Psychrobacter sp. I-STPA10]|uniref:hypothetical protein n=1 Tax=Psychrobacter sp. I-STPA10 TaxID=2585769 RepID=UPI001E556602|nr:hypothetical protein [Psychrobacter sp. I-STPA10]
MKVSKHNLLCEIKETTALINQIEALTQAIEKNSKLKMKDVLSLFFVEDQFTEELVGYIYDKKTSNIYEYVYNPKNDSILFSNMDMDAMNQEGFVTMPIIEEYLSLTEQQLNCLK